MQKGRHNASLEFYELVADIRKQSDVSCSLDSNCELTLMVSASACYTSGKNLSSLGHALSELSEILIIDLLDSVSTEHTNLLAGLLRRTGISFLFHDFSSYRNKVKLVFLRTERRRH